MRPRSRVSRGIAALAKVALVVAVAGCESGRGPGESPRATSAAPSAVPPRGLQARPTFVRGPTGGAPIAPFIAAELSKGRSEHRGVLVYVGATWCEPCQYFHRAVQAGELDEVLPAVRLIEFDLDADRDALEAAGYASRLIPLFALPGPDGTASGQRIEGSIKGEAAVRQNLVPRLQAFLKGQTG